MNWKDAVAESTQIPTRSTHQTRGLYRPPHLKGSYNNNGVPNFNNTLSPSFNGVSSELTTHSRPWFPDRFDSPTPGRGVRSLSRGVTSSWGRPPSRGRGRGRGPPLTRPNPYNVADDLDGLDLTEDGDETTDDNLNSNAINFDAYEDIPVEASGSDVPKPATSFDEIDLDESLKRNIKRCKYVKPTPIQRHGIPIAIAGRDLMACAQTGSGKTAAFCFPIISLILKENLKRVAYKRGGGNVAYPSALILSPTRELSCQIHKEATRFAYQTGVKVVVVYGGAPTSQQFRNLKNGVDILVATPGRLIDMIDRARVSLKKIKYLVLDEADRMLDMGFEPQIREIVQQTGMPPPGTRHTMLFSATFPDEIQRLASDFLLDYIFLTVGKVGSSTDLIEQRVELVEDMDKRSRLMEILRTSKVNGTHGKTALTLVFVETKKGADALEHWLSMNGFPAIAIHGDKVQWEREQALKSFKTGATSILVATDVASRGLDIPHVAHVINFDFPKDVDDYVHRIGRTGRAGKTGLATAFFSDKNMTLAKPLVELMQDANQQVPPWLLEYAQNPSFGQSKSYHRGRRFGGSDFRRNDQSSSENYFYSDVNSSGMDAYASGSGVVYEASVASEYHGNYSYESQETVVATGWD